MSRKGIFLIIYKWRGLIETDLFSLFTVGHGNERFLNVEKISSLGKTKLFKTSQDPAFESGTKHTIWLARR